MSEKFTPGEWRVESFYYETGKRTIYEIVYNEDGDRVAESIDKKEDAYLMAASKEMYRFIKRLYNCGLLRRIDMEEAEKLLQKARGGE